MWVPIVIIAVCTVVLSYVFSNWLFGNFLNDQGFYCGDDGRWHCVRAIEDAEQPVDFTYALPDGLCEAFQVGTKDMPEWAVNDPHIDVVISEPQRVVLKRTDDEAVRIPKGDWVIKLSNGSYGAIADKDFHTAFVKVKRE